jgi:pimeloyl-ACP methyl ester carboxylesterase
MIYSKVTGEGLPVVLVHGYGEDHSLWDNLSLSLSTHFKVICVDLPGFGSSPRLDGQFSLDQVAESLRDHLINDLQLSQCVVLGHSLGGYVSLALAENHPELLLGFGLINSTALADSPEKKQNRLKTADFIRKHKASFFLNNFVPNLFYEENRHKLVEEINFVIAMGNELDEDLLANYMLAMKERPDRLQLLSEYEHVLFIGGEKDSGFTKKDYNAQLSAIKNSDNGHILDNVGHMSMYEAPEELYAISFRYLNSI